MKRLNQTLAMSVAFGVMAFAGTAQGEVLIDDHFNDGNLGTNTFGVGSGFTANFFAAYPDDQLPSTAVAESGSVVTVTNTSAGVGDFSAVAVTSINSNDTFQFFNAHGVTARFDVASVTVADTGLVSGWDFTRAYVGLMNAGSTVGGPHPIGTNSAMNISVRLFGTGPGANIINAATTQGALVLRKGDGGEEDDFEVVSSWEWATYDGTGPLSITMSVDENGYNITFSDGTTAQVGTWAATTTNFTAADWVEGARAYAHSQIMVEGSNAGPGQGVFSLDRVVVTQVPEPASIALLGLGAAVMVRRRRV